MKNRKEIERDILAFAKTFTLGGGNHQVYTNLFAAMSDDQFKVFWNGVCDSGFIPMYVDNYNPKEMISYDNIVKLCAAADIPLEQQLIITDPDSGLTHTTPEKAIVGRAEVRKQRQILIKKFGASKHDHSVEDLTGQASGASRAGGISNPELQVLLSLNLRNTAKELADVRGGDRGAYSAYKNDLLSSGTTTVQSSLLRGTGVKSLQTAHFLLRAQLLDNNFMDR